MVNGSHQSQVIKPGMCVCAFSSPPATSCPDKLRDTHTLPLLPVEPRPGLNFYTLNFTAAHRERGTEVALMGAGHKTAGWAEINIRRKSRC